MLERLRTEAAAALADAIRAVYGIDHDPVVELPPRRELGDLAFPAALHLARELKQPPRAIAQALAEALAAPAFVARTSVEGPGYLNLFLDRSQAAAELLDGPILGEPPDTGRKVIVEHTNINPNKAAHIGHLRNAVLGDVLGRCLRALGDAVEVQNYIDDTGVQVADVVVGFLDLRGMDLEEIAALEEPFDFYCWDLYAEVGSWFEEDTGRLELRRETLHALEAGKGVRAEAAELVASRVLARHLATMRRLDITYDLLTHESDILGLQFFDVAFEQLKASGAVRLEADGKNAGCWVMPLSGSAEFAGLEDPDKVIVRSDGTVTYVGKDISYQLWKFGLLGKDFHYRFWEEERLWQTSREGNEDHPPFGAGDRVINVIDARQSYLQKIVKAGLEALGHEREAGNSVHFAYEMVSLSRGTAERLGFAAEGDERGGGLEMSGRKGIGVKADDLLDKLEEACRGEISARNRELSDPEVEELARQIAVAALRFFMVKATTTRVIAFDLDEALSFEGDSGPYLQYSLVRARNIRRRLAEAGIEDDPTPASVRDLPPDIWSDDLWDLAFFVAQIPEKVAAAGNTLELSILARHSLELAQRFHAIYHRHPILQEENSQLRLVRLASMEIFVRGLETLSGLMGVPVPSRM